ncbi:DUF2927 domain-containing protein [Acuticoccus kandeliae]|uniref:DUF2927 domain-containing protein n=1 Tax=Acuticoccus kandeliae TaxID=2073160 RepID=UPI0013004039|nr:DUF2927 domain-containing protein [Acuticoccus kandeliae]
MRAGWRLRRTLGRALRATFVTAALAFGTLGAGPALAQTVPFTDQELTDGFVLTVFGSETDVAGARPGSRIVKKFTGPVTFHIVSTSLVDRVETTRAFVEQLGATIQNLDLAEVASVEDADMVIFLVDRANYRETIRETVWPGVDGAFLEENACSAVIASRPTGIERAHVYLVADEGFLGLSHCMVEEIAQSLGPANDSPLLKDSIFNDESDLNVFGLFDWFLLNMLYDSRIVAGMSEAEARDVLPAVIADVRALVTELFQGGGAFLAQRRQVMR